MLMFTEQKGEGRTTQESTQPCFANVLSIWSKFRDKRPQAAGHTRAKTATNSRESLDLVLGNVKSSPHVRTNFPPSPPLVAESPRGGGPHSVAEDREHPLGEEEIRENFRNSSAGRDTNEAKIVPSMSGLKMSPLHFQSATNCQATDLSQPCERHRLLRDFNYNKTFWIQVLSVQTQLLFCVYSHNFYMVKMWFFFPISNLPCFCQEHSYS